MKPYTTADRLKQIMSERNLRQVDILKRCQPYCEQYNIKLGRSHLSQYISGVYMPDQWKLTVLALALNVSETWLMGYDVPMERTDASPNGLTFKNIRPLTPYIRLPKLGAIHAGSAIPTEQGVFGEWDYADAKYGDGRFFMLDVVGDCMSPTIPEGSEVIVQAVDYDLKPKKIVACGIEGDMATLKRYYPQADGSILLRGDNPDSESLIFTPDKLACGEFHIIGVVRSCKINF